MLLPTLDLRPTGKAIVEFTWSVKAKEAIEKLRGKTSAGLVDDYIDCRLIHISKPPYSKWLAHRKPLTSRAAIYDTIHDGPPNLRAGLQYSGRAVVLSGFPATIHPLSILERLNKEGFYPVKAPGLSTGWAAMDEIVHLKRYGRTITSYQRHNLTYVVVFQPKFTKRRKVCKLPCQTAE